MKREKLTRHRDIVDIGTLCCARYHNYDNNINHLTMKVFSVLAVLSMISTHAFAAEPCEGTFGLLFFQGLMHSSEKSIILRDNDRGPKRPI